MRHIDLLRACVAAERSRRPFAIRPWVVLPEHMHWMWTLPVGDADFPTRWRRIKTDFSRSLARTERRSEVRVSRGERGIWQRRYWEHQIRDEVDFSRHFDYIHYNPVKHGWTRSPALWLHSSFGEMVARGVYHRDWASPVAFDVGGDG